VRPLSDWALSKGADPRPLEVSHDQARPAAARASADLSNSAWSGRKTVAFFGRSFLPSASRRSRPSCIARSRLPAGQEHGPMRPTRLPFIRSPQPAGGLNRNGGASTLTVASFGFSIDPNVRLWFRGIWSIVHRRPPMPPPILESKSGVFHDGDEGTEECLQDADLWQPRLPRGIPRRTYDRAASDRRATWTRFIPDQLPYVPVRERASRSAGRPDTIRAPLRAEVRDGLSRLDDGATRPS
jgi:hypothetical protein